MFSLPGVAKAAANLAVTSAVNGAQAAANFAGNHKSAIRAVAGATALATAAYLTAEYTLGSCATNWAGRTTCNYTMLGDAVNVLTDGIGSAVSGASSVASSVVSSVANNPWTSAAVATGVSSTALAAKGFVLVMNSLSSI